jgi:hypothetical protein
MNRIASIALAAGLTAAGLPSLAATPTLTQALAQMSTEPASAYLGRPGMQVRDAHELARMQAYLQAHYEGVVARHHFELSPGLVYDCVDELTQPGARRLGLTRENWVSRPSQLPAEPALESNGLQQALDHPLRDPGIFLQPTADAQTDADGHAKSCAKGTIPMRRLELKRMAAFETLEHFRHKRGRPSGQGIEAGEAPESTVHEHAKAYEYVTNWGAESTLNVWKAYTEKPSEFSLSQIWVVGGTGSGLQTVEAGWQVYRNRHTSHPSDAHLFIYSTQDDYNSTGCYDLECDDFVQTDSSVAIGGYYTKQSVVGGSQYVSKILIQKDGTTGNWWVAVGGVYAGYYPRSLYNSAGIRDQAAKVTFGGEIVNTWPSGRHTKTDMGSGYKPADGFGYAAYQRTIRYVNTSNFYTTPSLTEWRANAACYDIDSGYDSGSWKTYVYLGGEGYNSSTCP